MPAPTRPIAVLSASALMLIAGAAVAAPAQTITGPTEVSFRDLKATPAPVAQGREIQAIQALAQTSKYMLLQFDAPLSKSLRDKLATAGVSVLSTVDARTAYVSVNPQDLDTLPAGAKLTGISAIQPNWKLHPAWVGADKAIPEYAITRSVTDPQTRQPVDVTAAYVLFHNDVTLDDAKAIARDAGAIFVDEIRSLNGLVLEVPVNKIDALASIEAIRWIEPPLPKLTPNNDSNRQVTEVDQAFDNFGLEGEGVTAFIYDSGTARASHTGFNGRLTVIDGAGISTHPTHVAGTVGASGEHRGMAPAVNLLSASFQFSGEGVFLYSNPGDFETDYALAFGDLGADISNNSIGSNVAPNGFDCNIQGDYGVMSSLIDAAIRGSVTNGDPIVVVWAGGNERGSGRCGTTFETLAPPSTAKNHIAVAAVNSNDKSMTSFSSWGPTDDGRLKPDISAPGCQSNGDSGVTSLGSSNNNASATLCGTSMAAPTVTGIGVLMIEHFRNLYPGREDMLNSTVKAYLAHNAEDLGNPGPDYAFGYGLVRTNRTLFDMNSGRFSESAVDQGGEVNYPITINRGIFDPPANLRITIAWDDAPGEPFTQNALVNNLDLVVTGPDGTRYYPYTLDPANPNNDAVQTQEDSINNMEQVYIPNAANGNYSVSVRGTSVPVGPQSFSLVSSDPFTGISTSFVSTIPQLVAPGTELEVAFDVNPISQSVVNGSAKLFYRANETDPYIQIPTTPSAGDVFTATLPPVNCDQTPGFYFEVQGTTTGLNTTPPGGASSPFTIDSIGAISVAADDDMETDQGWTVGAPGDGATSGIWERADPEGTTSQPEIDNSPEGTQCWVTGAAAGGGTGANDIDGGRTTLTSPTYAVAAFPEAEISYARWYNNAGGASPGADVFLVEISNNNGASWTNLETVGPAGEGTTGGWITTTFRIADFVTPTDQVRLRFIAADEGDGSLVEAAIDDLRISSLGCDPVSTGCPGDADNSNAVDLADLNLVLSNFGLTTDQGDVTGNGVVDLEDLNLVLSNFGSSC